MVEIIEYEDKYLENIRDLKVEEYFKSMECQYVLVDVFAYNTSGISFYNKKGYHNRMHTMIKDIRR